jgi:hypothetical protein
LAWPYAGSYAHHVAAAPLVHTAAWGHAAHLAAPWAPITQYSSIDLAHHVPAYAHHIPAAKIIAAPAVHALPVHGASYTAANRGSVHTAPLPGHAVSQTSLNLAPAPGTL